MPVFSVSSCNKTDKTLNYVLSLYDPNNQPTRTTFKAATQSDEREKVVDFNKQIIKLDNFKQNILDDLVYRSFHFLNENKFEINKCQFTPDDKNFLDLYYSENSPVKFAASISKLEFNDLDGSKHELIFNGMFQVVFTRDYTPPQMTEVPAGTTITFIVEVDEYDFFDLENLPPSLSYYEKKDDQYLWKPYYPNYQNKNNFDQIFGIIQTNKYQGINFGIDKDYFLDNEINYCSFYYDDK